ncbi:MAG: nitrite reductase, copper-containing [Anaerolineae bacterium]|nr:nitrite reductase, copper-containing [Anaerolineae bacterium]
MNKQLNPNLVAIVLVGFTVLFLAVLPIRIEFATNDVQAQATLANTEPVQVAQAENTKVVEYTLRTITGQMPPMAFIGVGGSIDGQINPPLIADAGDTVRITLINGDPVLHNLMIDEFNATTGDLLLQEQSATIEFAPDKPGDFVYYCSTPGHREVGMWGTLTIHGEASSETVSAVAPAEIDVAPTVPPAVADATSIVRNPADLPAPIGDRDPTNVRVDLNAIEVNGILSDGTTYRYFTFDGAIPGPMIRTRVGDTVEMHIHNDTSSQLQHSIDLHAVTGPGGGAVYTQTNPGEETAFTFKTLAPGVFVYHCATPSVAHHIASGMFGLIIVEPEGGLPPVDREFYIMQSEIYTTEPYGTQGNLTFNHEAMLNEQPQYFVFNGAANALTADENALHANVGETVRIFFGVGGPNFTSSFHVIGEIFDRVYNYGSLTTPPMTDVQTTLVPPGGATMVEFTLEVPGRYILVDHALARLERGLAGYLYAEGEDNPDIFRSTGEVDTAGH